MQLDQIPSKDWDDVPKPKYIARIARAEREEEFLDRQYERPEDRINQWPNDINYYGECE